MTDPISWSSTLVQKVAPDEVDLAPAITEAFLRGGKARDDLFRRSSTGGASAFDPFGAIVLTPWILKGIVAAGPYLESLLSWAGEVTSLVLNANSIVEIIQKLSRHKTEGHPAPEIPVRVHEDLRKTVHAFATALESTGWPQDQRDALTYRAIKALLEDPGNAKAFTKSLQAQ